MSVTLKNENELAEHYYKILINFDNDQFESFLGAAYTNLEKLSNALKKVYEEKTQYKEEEEEKEGGLFSQDREALGILNVIEKDSGLKAQKYSDVDKLLDHVDRALFKASGMYYEARDAEFETPGGTPSSSFQGSSGVSTPSSFSLSPSASGPPKVPLGPPASLSRPPASVPPAVPQVPLVSRIPWSSQFPPEWRIRNYSFSRRGFKFEIYEEQDPNTQNGKLIVLVTRLVGGQDEKYQAREVYSVARSEGRVIYFHVPSESISGHINLIKDQWVRPPVLLRGQILSDPDNVFASDTRYFQNDSWGDSNISEQARASIESAPAEAIAKPKIYPSDAVVKRRQGDLRTINMDSTLPRLNEIQQAFLEGQGPPQIDPVAWKNRNLIRFGIDHAGKYMHPDDQLRYHENVLSGWDTLEQKYAVPMENQSFKDRRHPWNRARERAAQQEQQLQLEKERFINDRNKNMKYHNVRLPREIAIKYERPFFQPRTRSDARKWNQIVDARSTQAVKGFWIKGNGNGEQPYVTRTQLEDTIRLNDLFPIKRKTSGVMFGRNYKGFAGQKTGLHNF